MDVLANLASPPTSSPTGSPSGRKRVLDGENASEAPKRKRLMGRALGEQLKELDNNAVSNTSTTELTASQKLTRKPLFGRSLAATSELEEQANADLQAAGHETESQATALSNELMSLPTPPGEEHPPQSHLVGQSTPISDFGRTTSGKRTHFVPRMRSDRVSYEKLIAQRSEAASEGKAQKNYYGIDIHELIKQAETEPTRPREPELSRPLIPSVEDGKSRKRAGLMWTEKYRAKKFTDLVGDERTHRHVLRWLKAWDPVVFPGAGKSKAKFGDDENQHRKILMLTGPPGLGKTTLAHVCAKQAGYEIVEINASDERSSGVVKNKIRDCVGTENVRGVNVKSSTGETKRRAGKPVCLVVDEVDGVVSGNSGGGGEGGFIKALIDLIQLDQKNSRSTNQDHGNYKNKKRDKFRLLRPIVLVCNDVYHPSLRPLRSAGLAEIIHVRKPGLDKVIDRVKHVFEAEGVACDSDAVRRLCEHTWGVSNRKEGKTGASTSDGDIRSILVVSEWAAAKLRATSNTPTPRLTKQWIETNITNGPASEGRRGLGRGGAKEAAERVFLENAGFAKSKLRSLQISNLVKTDNRPKAATDIVRHEPIRMLREVVETTGDFDRVMSEVFSSYPRQDFQDDNYLTKPNAAHEWLHFHDTLSSKVFSGQAWELIPYQSTPTLGFHYLFGSSTRQSKSEAQMKDAEDAETVPVPFSGPRADFEAREAEKEIKATLDGLQQSLNINLNRMFRSSHQVAVELLPQLIRMLTPEVKPVVIGGKGESMASVRREGEKDMVRRSVEAMGAVGAAFERMRVDDPRASNGGWIYRMEPALDSISTFDTLTKTTSSASGARFAVRQIMDQEHKKFLARQAAEARQARFNGGASEADLVNIAEDTTAPTAVVAEGKVKVKRDFFGRVVKEEPRPESKEGRPQSQGEVGKCQVKTWVSFNEGFSNAVRKPITLRELLDGL